ncbi:uncharacterized protein LOC129591492 isoform X2 [Paramacrobiotus metropolitanus]|uniref:uncharacterized protein LOC129591492 isoform X2 n=1 Tax=Paramacrobiotus metropolitanus TaxID=2943436 RepID=UPI002445C0FB|nr:uncharacterized protein LOC129591492 isoform X2 [Paramacrobiotus metropolitanus]
MNDAARKLIVAREPQWCDMPLPADLPTQPNYVAPMQLPISYPAQVQMPMNQGYTTNPMSPQQMLQYQQYQQYQSTQYQPAQYAQYQQQADAAFNQPQYQSYRQQHEQQPPNSADSAGTSDPWLRECGYPGNTASQQYQSRAASQQRPAEVQPSTSRVKPDARVGLSKQNRGRQRGNQPNIRSANYQQSNIQRKEPIKPQTNPPNESQQPQRESNSRKYRGNRRPRQPTIDPNQVVRDIKHYTADFNIYIHKLATVAGITKTNEREMMYLRRLMTYAVAILEKTGLGNCVMEFDYSTVDLSRSLEIRDMQPAAGITCVQCLIVSICSRRLHLSILRLFLNFVFMGTLRRKNSLCSLYSPKPTLRSFISFAR